MGLGERAETAADAFGVLDSLGSRRYHDVENDRQAVEGRCPVCGGGFEVGCHWNFYPGCTSCWEPHVYRHRVSPAALEHRDWGELMAEYERVFRHKLAGNLDGTCVECGSPTGSDSYWNEVYRGREKLRDVRAISYCHACSYDWIGTVGLLVLVHPTVREYADEHHVDFDVGPFWAHEWTLTDLTTTVDDDPWRVEKTVTIDGYRLAVVFADDGSVDTITHVDLRPGERAGSRREATERSHETTDSSRVDGSTTRAP